MGNGGGLQPFQVLRSPLGLPSLCSSSSVCPSALLVFSTPLLPSPFFLRALPVLRLPALQWLSPCFCFLHYLSLPPTRVLTGMTGSRLWLGAGRGRGKGAARTPAAEHPPPTQAPHLQASLAPGVSAPGQAGRRDLDERPDPRPRSGNVGLGDRGWRSGEIRPWGWGEGSGSQSLGQPTGGLILPNSPAPKPPNDNVWKEVISGGELFIVQPQDVKSKPEVGSSSPLPRLGRGRRSPHRHREDVLGPGLASDRQIIQCQARSRGLGPGQKPGQGGQDGGCTHPRLRTRRCLPPQGCCSPPTPRTAWNMSEPSHPLPLPFSAQRTQQIPWGLQVVGWG